MSTVASLKCSLQQHCVCLYGCMVITITHPRICHLPQLKPMLMTHDLSASSAPNLHSISIDLTNVGT